tara:strand:+ start:276 stop:920 length:645 start_codon:yes stop_codon:yes gene_type:complete
MNKHETEVFNERQLKRIRKAVDVLDEASGIEEKSIDIDASWKKMRSKINESRNIAPNFSEKTETVVALIFRGVSSIFSTRASGGVFVVSIGLALSFGIAITSQIFVSKQPYTININDTGGATLFSEDKVPEIGQGLSFNEKKPESLAQLSVFADELLAVAINLGLTTRIVPTNYGFDLLLVGLEEGNIAHDQFRKRYKIPVNAGESIRFVVNNK